jgi:hypothetical protein
MAKVRKHLSLDVDAVERGERYSAIHGTSLSRLVSDFLSRLPMGDTEETTDLAPVVRRLVGIAAANACTGRQVDEQDYHDYLWAKYGGR